METVKFAFVIDGEFAGAFDVSEAHPAYEHLCAVMRSGPEIIEIQNTHPNFNEIQNGWTYNNGDWAPPAE